MYMQSNLHDQFAVQPDTHSNHALSAAHLPTPTDAGRASINNRPPLGYVEMWRWENMSQ